MEAPERIWIPTYRTHQMFDEWSEEWADEGDICYIRADYVALRILELETRIAELEARPPYEIGAG